MARPTLIAENEMFDELRQQLARAVMRACPQWLAEQREDIVQEAMIRVMRQLERSEERTLNASYLWRVGYSVTIDHIRKLRARREVSLGSSGDADGAGGRAIRDPEDEGAGASPERAALASEIRGTLGDCLAGLVEARRRAVTLYLLGHGVGEIASLLGCKYKRAENLVYRGLAQLRTCMAEKGVSL